MLPRPGPRPKSWSPAPAKIKQFAGGNPMAKPPLFDESINTYIT
jgi:hypothetical protein